MAAAYIPKSQDVVRFGDKFVKLYPEHDTFAEFYGHKLVVTSVLRFRNVGWKIAFRDTETGDEEFCLVDGYGNALDSSTIAFAPVRFDTAEGRSSSLCPICGMLGDNMVFAFYCSNGRCQNYRL